MRLVQFDQERWQCKYENVVDYNLSESSVHALSTRELLDSDDEIRRILDTPLGYSQADGTEGLRAAIASTYGKLSPEHVMVANGSSEANFVAAWHLFEKGDELVLMVPNYAQVWGLAKNWNVGTKHLWLREELGWQFDPEDLKKLVSKKTKVVQVCNPNNPTGAVMAREQRKALLDAVKDAGAWLMSDEIYLGSEREGDTTESLWDGYERTLITNGLSKAYGLPGLRTGWLVGAPETINDVKPYRDYLTLSPSVLSDRLAQAALEPRRRMKILERTRGIIRNNYPIVRDWLDDHGTLFSHLPPTAGASSPAAAGQTCFSIRRRSFTPSTPC